MAMYYSKFFGVPHSAFEEKGVLDGFIGRDMRLHIDPLRLKNTQVPEFIGSYESVFLKYFDRFAHLVDAMPSEEEDDTFFPLIVENMQFPEIPNVGLGYSVSGRPGKGMNGKTTKQIAKTTVKVIKAGMRDPELFLFMHLFEKNVGADRISDMAVSILRHQILSYTQRVAADLNIATREFEFEDVTYTVPFYEDEPMHFFPTTLLADLPMATSYDEISDVCDYNKGLVGRVCKAVHGEWKQFFEGTDRKNVLKNALLNNPEAYKEAISYFRSLSAVPYDFSEDKKKLYFKARIEELVTKVLEEQGTTKKLSPEEVLQSTRSACMLFKECVENHRSYKLMYYEKSKIAKSEDYAQELLFVISEAYIKAKGADIDISPEADTGVGKLDFKFSQGSNSRVIIETKLSNNNDLLHGYVTQLPDYVNSQHGTYGIYVVVIVDSKKNKISQLKKLRDIEAKRDKNDLSQYEIIFVDARERPTASKR